MINRKNIKNFMLMLTAILLAMAFPLQVFADSPFPSLIPYLILIFVMLSASFSNNKKISTFKSRNIDVMVALYLFIFTFNSIIQLFIFNISYQEVIASIVNYVAPVIFYYFFRTYAEESGIKYFLIGVAIAGAITGGYFAYDSFLKLAFGEVNDYAREAFEYSIIRSGINLSDANTARIAIESRSFGLLQSHTISGAWVVLGSLAVLALLPREYKFIRLSSIVIYGSLLAAGLNFSNIIAYALIITWFEFGGIRLLELKIQRNILLEGMKVIAILFTIAGIIFIAANDKMLEMIELVINTQINIIFGTGSTDNTLKSLTLGGIETLAERVMDWPVILLWGDGFTSFGLPKGGDFGITETIAHFGLPFYFAIIVGCIILIKSASRKINKNYKYKNFMSGPINEMQFCSGVLILIFILDVHYSAWPAKSILPIIFSVFALYGRYSRVYVASPKP
jgi:hypothetical protein